MILFAIFLLLLICIAEGALVCLCESSRRVTPKYTSVNAFAKEIAKDEGKKKQLSIAQILEVLRIANDKLKDSGVDLYGLIRGNQNDK